MNWPLFTNPALLGGLALLGVPILIHLLLRIKKKQLRFSTLQFFRRQDEQAKRRRKVRNWLLLVTRLLLFLLLVLAFARPYLTDKRAAARNTPLRQLILVVDRSASMAAADPEGPRWERAKSAMQTLLDNLGPNDRAALISCTVRAETLAEPTTAQEALKVLGPLEPTHGAADLGQGLQLAARLVANTSSQFTNTICVVSDLQRASCPNLGSFPVPREAHLEVLNIGDLFAPNAAITELQLAPTNDAKPSLTLMNFAEENMPGIALQLWLDEKQIASAQLDLAGGASTNLDLVLPRIASGWHTAEARIQPRDAQALDDVRQQTFYVPPPVRALVVEPRRVPRLFQEESFFVVSALDPVFGLTNADASRFAIEKSPPDDLVRRLQLRNSPSPYDVVVLPGLKSIAANLSAALSEFVRAGGGLLLFLNDDLSANRYNAEFADWLPVQLEKLESASGLDWRLWEHAEQSPVFTAFKEPNSGNLALSRFTRRAALQPDEQATVMARFQDGVPLMIEQSLGQGRVMLVNTSADTAWTDWPKHKTFVPWLHCLVRFLAHRNAAEAPAADYSMVAGAESVLDLGPDYQNRSFTLVCPNGKTAACATDAQGWLPDVDMSTRGVYSLREAPDREALRWVVNVPVGEADLVAMPPDEFERQVARTDSPRNASLAAGWFGPRNDRQELWRVLLVAGLILLLLETFLANRTLA